MKCNHFYIIVPLALLTYVFLFRVQSAVSASYGIRNGLPVSQQAAKTDIPTDQIILKFKDTNGSKTAVIPTQTEQVQRLNEAAGISLTYSREMSGGVSVYKLPRKTAVEDVRNMAKKLMALPEVEYAEPDLIMQIMTTPNDPRYPDQWHYFAPTTGNYGINMPAAWDIITGTSNIVVAVIDTGITDHADLAGRTVPGYDFIGDTSVSNDGDGRDADPHDPGDWTTVNQCGFGWPGENSSWHGTHVAGTIGAASNNGLGVAGINWNSKILPVRVLGACGGYSSDIVDGMLWAAGLPVFNVPVNAHPAKVLSLSLGGSGSCPAIYQTAINEITAAGATVVVAAGNSQEDVSLFTPANCNGVISVAATDRYGNRAYYSNFGSSIKISAPGGAQSGPTDPNGVLSTLNTGSTTPASDTYAYYQGTSMATPHVSGVASLLYSLDPSITPAQVLTITQNTVTAFPPGSTCNTSNCGPGILNAGAAVRVLPRLTKMNLSYVNQGSGPVTLIVTGTNFLTGSVINWDGSPLSTTRVYSTELTTTVTATSLKISGMHKISVTVPHPVFGSLKTSTLPLKVGNLFVFLPVVSKPAPPLPNWTTILTENFEGAFPGVWQFYNPDSSAYSWGKRTCNPYQGSNSAWAFGGGTSGSKLGCTANYPLNQKPWMIYGPFSLQDAQGAELHFKYWTNTEPGFDYLCWYASEDNSNYYGNCTSGSSSGWLDGVFDLNSVYTIGSLAGQPQVWIAFVFSSDGTNAFTGGAYVDDVTLRKCSSISGCFGSLAIQPSANNNLKWEGATKTLVR